MKPSFRLRSLVALSFLGLASVSVAACGGEDADDSAESGDALSRPLSYVGQQVVQALTANFPLQKGKTWSVSQDAKLAGDFVVQVPPRATWGQAFLSVADRCEAGDTRCEADFGLRICAQESDCGGHGHCTTLQATVAHRNGAPKKVCAGHSDELLDQIWSTMTATKTVLDITSLSPPDGRFEAAVRNALTYMSEAPNPPRVRMFFGDFPGGNIWTDKTLASLTRDVAASSKLDVSVGTWRSGTTSWNHAKIIARDGELALVGGTNMWDVHYLRNDPVHDLWIQVEGGPAADAARFADELWKVVCEQRATINSLAARPYKRCPAAFGNTRGSFLSGGTASVISMGRLGAVGAHPSDVGLVTMIRAAKSSIHLSQQDLGPIHRAGVELGDWPDAVITALAGAMTHGVDVNLVLSNTSAVPGDVSSVEALFNTYDNGWSPQEVAAKFVDAARTYLRVARSNADPVEVVCSHLKLMRLRSSGAEAWSDGKTLANHGKVVVVDERAFYVGSQNLYVADLGEFGYLVDDEAATKTFLASYVDNVEKHSARTAISGPNVTCRIPASE
ncbi:hypothetical protein AKJ09_04338 [Labilithrix luteola]|uniref:PLD phosphodiesterase domain-containing protein n=1 Tax=Labilithrix luteola TaxID=1391654 RepID=A0A0K1PX13_9BACT|nr:phospholipase D-like domain-containing protein [Labilithrix luteola]AKU97674.1 hypothetical protein AKJ09_04338 [Labilithrix luteola]